MVLIQVPETETTQTQAQTKNKNKNSGRRHEHGQSQNDDEALQGEENENIDEPTNVYSNENDTASLINGPFAGEGGTDTDGASASSSSSVRRDPMPLQLENMTTAEILSAALAIAAGHRINIDRYHLSQFLRELHSHRSSESKSSKNNNNNNGPD